MKSKTFIFNALFVGMMGLFLVGLFTVLPPTTGQAKDPAAKPGLSIKTLPAEEVAVDTVAALPTEDAPPPAETPTEPVPSDGVDLDWLLTKENAVAAALMLLITFLSKWLPFLSKITDTEKRALTVGMTLILGFVTAKWFGGGLTMESFFSLGITYLLTSLGYDKVLKPMGVKTPKVAS